MGRVASSRRHGRIREEGAGAARPLPPEARLRRHAGAGRRRAPDAAGRAAAPIFVVQKHWASRLHYDFRLELDGVLLSWAVPKGPSFDPSKKQMAIHVEDHPLGYASFEGTIPPRQYGAGTVIVWDRGTWEPVGDPREGMAKGKLVFRLHGEKLAGLWELVRIAKPGDQQDALDAVQEARRMGAAARRVRRDRGAARQRRRQAARPGRRARAARRAGAARGASRRGRASPTSPTRSKAPLPAKLEPQLATLVAAPPAGDWIVETKFDGYRLMARIDDGKATADHARRPRLDRQDAAARRGDRGARHRRRPGSTARSSSWATPACPTSTRCRTRSTTRTSEAIDYFVFDLPFLDGHDLRKVPLRARRALLQRAARGAADASASASARASTADAGADARGGAAA